VIRKVEQWSIRWGFKFSVEKTQTVFFSRRKVGEEIYLKLYGRNLERVGGV
jgi:predicted SpoU family rRNA methylase